MTAAVGSAMPPLIMALLFGFINKGAPFFIRPIAKAISANVSKFFSTPSSLQYVAWVHSTHPLDCKSWPNPLTASPNGFLHFEARQLSVIRIRISSVYVHNRVQMWPEHLTGPRFTNTRNLNSGFIHFSCC